ncbi:MAG: hypothetical protein NUW06_01870 [Candidatus Acetothermia bacterium]|jgi:hypothetical protein|nr:hypothetical protein [Candidatus Acetothermia bacterium]MDH7504681.1 hypothetical protein [Candidatus Acetothermia bacterium]
MSRNAKLGIIIGLSLTLAVGTGIVLAQLFGMGEYPGGHLKTVYQILSEESPNPARFSLEIEPLADGNYKITSTTEAIEPQDQVELGLFSLFFLGFSLRPESEQLDLTPLLALGEREIEPNKSYVLEGGARLVTQERTEIAGVEVVMGIYTHPSYADQRALIALPNVATRKILPFPPLLQVEKQEGGQYKTTAKVELTEFLHE